MVESIAERIIKFVSNQINYNDKTLSVGTSIGISTQNANYDNSLDEVMHQADIALYSAKNAGRNTYWIYQESDNQEVFSV